MISKGSSSILYNDILDKITEETILKYYFGISTIPCLINAPYREDKKPSLGIFYTNSSIAFKDFATYNSGNVVELLKLYLNTDYWGVLQRLSKDLPKMNLTTIDKKETHYNKKHIITSSSIEVKIRNWKDYDLEYWESYGISLPWLQFGDVYPISHIFLYKNI